MAAAGSIVEGCGKIENEERLIQAVAGVNLEATAGLHASADVGEFFGGNSELFQQETPVRKETIDASHEHPVCLANDVNGAWICAICMDEIPVQEFSQIKGCEHSYCATCVLRWASCKSNPWCPQCRMPFSMLYLYRTLEGSLSDYMLEESVCLLLCASWFKALPAFDEVEAEDYYIEDEEDYEEDEAHYSSLRIGNRRWGENGFVRGGRMEARPVNHKGSPNNGGASSSRPKASNGSGGAAGSSKQQQHVGRRAKRAQQRENADSAAPSKASSRSGRR